MASLRDLLDLAGTLRYGIPTSQKEIIARQQLLPGAPPANTETGEEADRYSAGYLFGLQHPELAEWVQPAVSRLKTSDVPFFGGSSPELRSYADAASQQRIAAGRRGQTLADIIGRRF
jgi:hypothetical protein